MSKITWTETELEKGSGAFLKAAASLPGRVISVSNGVVSVGNQHYAIESTMFKKLIKTGCIKPYRTDYVVTDLGMSLADK